jgi:hypothetical protein
MTNSTVRIPEVTNYPVIGFGPSEILGSDVGPTIQVRTSYKPDTNEYFTTVHAGDFGVVKTIKLDASGGADLYDAHYFVTGVIQAAAAFTGLL